MYELKKRFKICAAHKLDNETFDSATNKNWFGRCNTIHGHNYYITITLRTGAEKLGPTGMLINFNDLKEIFKTKIDDIYDHKLLNDCPGFGGKVASAENMAKIFYDVLEPYVKDLYSVEVEETEGASATYKKLN